MFSSKKSAASPPPGSPPPPPGAGSPPPPPADAPVGDVGVNPGGVAVSNSKKPLIVAAIAGVLALVGVLLLLSYLQSPSGEEALAEEPEPTTTVLIVDVPLTAGTTVGEILIDESVPVVVDTRPVSAVVPGAIRTAQELADLGDMMLSVDVFAGEQLLSSRFVPRDDFAVDPFSDRVAPVEIPEGHHQMVVSLPATKAMGGLIAPGDNVSVLMSFSGKDGIPDTTALVLPSIEVVNVLLAVEAIAGETTESEENLGVVASGDINVIVAVTPEELTRLTFATEFGKITLAVAVDEEFAPEDPLIDILTSVIGATPRPDVSSVARPLVTDLSPRADAVVEGDIE